MYQEFSFDTKPSVLSRCSSSLSSQLPLLLLLPLGLLMPIPSLSFAPVLAAGALEGCAATLASRTGASQRSWEERWNSRARSGMKDLIYGKS